MCGICGEVRRSGARPGALSAMARAIAHRGPDDEGFHVSGPVGLANRRLSIIDVDGGHQPIANEAGDVHVVLNGEIYNHQALRDELKGRGHRFSTASDTEVIVHLYEERGDDCVSALDGMFAFALWDERRQRLLLARDPLGQKPLYWARTAEGLVFASEIKSILASGDVTASLNAEALHHYLSLRFIPPPDTMFEGIHKLAAAHTLSYQGGEVRVAPYWRLSFANPLKGSDEEILGHIEEELRRAVSSHLVSDVPVGALLSGGMDSSAVVALAAEELPRPFQTFAIGTGDASFDERAHARAVAEHCGTTHIDERVEPDLVASLPRMVYHLDEPSDPIAACTYHAASLASRHVKVVLGGDGGDETFGGFDRYAGVGWVGPYAHLPAWLRRSTLGAALGLIPEDVGYKSWTQRLRWLDRLGDYRDPDERYAAATVFFRFDHAAKAAILGPEIWPRVREVDAAEAIVRELRAADSEDPLGRMLAADFATRLPEHSLMLTDRMSMAHGLEVRSPLLDRRLVELMARVPSRLKIRGRNLKVALRKVAGPWLPREIVARPKQGFMFPIADWLRGPLRDFARETLANGHAVRDGILRREACLALVDEHAARKVDHHVRIWMLLNLEVWYRMFVEGTSLNSLEEELRSRARALNPARR
jgi:asparagine synthase (glutamine-hydrolysing)